jgi:hypothetical protein
VKRTARTVSAEDGDVDRVQVTTFRLVKPYRPAMFAAAAKELDGVAAELAKRLHGKIASAKTLEVADRKVRTYRVVYNGRTQQLTFVLDGRHEYQLLCRRDTDGEDDACQLLVSSFALG